MSAGGPLNTFPKLLRRNASQFGSRAAIRHKDLGIWQTWTWAQVLEIVRAYAVGLQRLGLGRGDTIAIVSTKENDSVIYCYRANGAWLKWSKDCSRAERELAKRNAPSR